mmetsp:Transcript_27323/g.55840  ORF Transcript_27323/g.55840 Transcript_27323/m.55840 type:complete len:114 (+) Transcript_27323:626-967(+)
MALNLQRQWQQLQIARTISPCLRLFQLSASSLTSSVIKILLYFVVLYSVPLPTHKNGRGSKAESIAIARENAPGCEGFTAGADDSPPQGVSRICGLRIRQEKVRRTKHSGLGK